MTRRIYTPTAYQHLMVDHMLDVPRCGVWAGCGLGKTSSTLNALDILELSEPGPTLVCAPLRVAQSTWTDEAEKWAHLRHIEVTPMVGDVRARTAALKKAMSFSGSITTINYENIPWLHETLKDMKKPWPFRKIVTDEATKLRGFRLRQGTQRSKMLAKNAFGEVTRFIELTGTPAPKGLIDLWSQVWFLDQGRRLGRTFDAFTSRWFYTNHNGFGVSPHDYAQDQIQDALRDLCLSLDARDWFDLREPIHVPVYVDLPGRARKLYEDMEKRMFVELDGAEVESFNAAAKTMRCLQLANGTLYTDDEGAWSETHTMKLQALESILEERNGAATLIAYQFKSDLERLLRAFPNGRHLDKNPETLRDFKAGKFQYLFAHPASAGHGIDGLQTVCDAIVFFGHWWDLELRQQIIERVGPTRQAQAGLDRPMFIYDIITRDTIDEVVIARHETKRGVQDLLIEAMKRRRVK